MQAPTIEFPTTTIRELIPRSQDPALIRWCNSRRRMARFASSQRSTITWNSLNRQGGSPRACREVGGRTRKTLVRLDQPQLPPGTSRLPEVLARAATGRWPVKHPMPGRRLCSNAEAEARGFRGKEAARRRAVLRETIDVLERAGSLERFHRIAEENLERWHSHSDTHDRPLRIEVLPGDWGAVTLKVTKTYGVRFAVLNMANAYVPGGAYVEGAIAQEENMFRMRAISLGREAMLHGR